MDFDVSRGAENIENLSNQSDKEICIPKSSANSEKLEETKNKTGLNQEIEDSNGTNDIIRKRKLPRGKELPDSNKSPKITKLTRTQVALNCETLAALATKRKLNSASNYPKYGPETVSQYCLDLASPQGSTSVQNTEANENIDLVENIDLIENVDLIENSSQPVLPVISSISLPTEAITKNKDGKSLHLIGDLPHQPHEFPFKNVKIGGQNRSFKAKYFDEFKWLDFSEHEEKVYCFTCIKSIKHGKTFRNNSVPTAFTHNGFSAWQKVPNKFKEHQNSKEHQDAVLITEKLVSSVTPIEELFDTQSGNQKASNRKCLIKTIETIRLLALKNIAFRNLKKEDSIFYEMMEMRSNDVPELKAWLDKKHGNYLHHDIQNELLQIMAHRILREHVLKPIKNGSCISSNDLI